VFTNSLIKFPNGSANQKLAAWYKPSSNSTAYAKAFHHLLSFVYKTANKNGYTLLLLLCKNRKTAQVHHRVCASHRSHISSNGFQAWTGARPRCRWINAEYCRSYCICKSQNLQALFHWCTDRSTFRLLGIVGFGNGQELLETIFGEHYILFLAWKKQWILLQMRIGEFCCWYSICRWSQPTTVWCNGSATPSMSVKTKDQI
jgi:hypothetical protein